MHTRLIVVFFFLASLIHAQKSPNIVFILVDDFGWTDWQMNGNEYGSDFYETPNLDKLAQRGVFFSQAYSQPLCSPTRASLLTGKYACARLHMHQAITGNSTANPVVPATANPKQMLCWPESRNQLPLSEITIAEELKKNGYKTYHFGKWHLGSTSVYPTKQGFDEEIAVGSSTGPGGYFAPYQGMLNVEELSEGEYITERLTNEVVKKIEAVKNDKFFIYLAHYNVHSPYEAKPEVVAKYAAKADTNNRHHYPIMGAMVEALDESVGKIMDKLDELGIADNTIFVVMGDNGGVHWNNDNKYKNTPVTSNYPLRAGKGCFYEGGVRVPLIINYPAIGQKGVIENTPVHVVDFYPTLLKLTNTAISANKDVVDGEDISGLIQGTSKLHERPLFCHFPRHKQMGADVGGSYIRLGDYKLYRLYGLNDLSTDTYELYNVNIDISETNNLATKNIDLCESLKKRLNSWLIETNALLPKPNPNWSASPAVNNKE